MDNSGYFPQLSDDDPLYEIALYTQTMKSKLDTTTPVVKTDTNWLYYGKMNKVTSLVGDHFVNLGITLARNGGSFAITTNYLTIIPGFIPVGTRPILTVNSWAMMTSSGDAPLATIWWRIGTNGDLLMRLDSGSTTVATGNRIHLASNWQASNV